MGLNIINTVILVAILDLLEYFNNLAYCVHCNRIKAGNWLSIKCVRERKHQTYDPPTAPSIEANALHNDQIETEDDATHSKWHDSPMELLVHILVLADDRSIIVALGVCTGLRDAICVGVQDLSLSWCKRNMSNLVLSAVPRFNCLQSLNLRQNQHQLNEQAVEIVAKHCHDLRAIDLPNNTQLTDKSLEALARGFSLLEKLNISGCSGVSDHALIFLSEKYNKLRHLNLCGCVRAASDRALLALAHNCCHLQSLNLGWCEMVTDVGVTGLA
ncbi:F-box protein SKP2A-like [Cryptomeria japonica]|uniref:F-box protein SKP2A-like n=1 Tax=Cryptomeria japonica TaxID=3369 RepID=UPI0027DA9619|nr:F-box protein SKP2A-like [Cryptomeria japonica]